MSYLNASAYPTFGTRVIINGKDMPGAQNVSGLGGGSQSEIDTTTLQSSGTEYVLGLPDEGSATIDGVLALQHPLIKILGDARRNSTPVNAVVYMGGVPSDKQRTDGSAFVNQTGIAVTTSLVNSKLTYTTTKDFNELSAITEGDYVKDGSSFYKITALTETSQDKLQITVDHSSNTNATTIDTLTPAAKFVFTGRIGTFDKSASVNEVWRYSLQIRISGAVDETLGTPTLTIS